MHVRQPAVAGTFYEADATRLRRQIARCFEDREPATGRERFLGAVVPHAGLMYSGGVAAAAYASLDFPSQIVILCPNHTGLGAAIAIDPEGAWRTPLGDARIDDALAAAILEEAPFAKADHLAHAREHSLEVQLPFLQTVLREFTFVPICASSPAFERAADLGRALARAIRRARGPVALLASSDLNHYESQEIAMKKDVAAIERILALDPDGLWRTVHDRDISMCGIVPTTAMLVAARELGASEARLLEHATSGDVTGDPSSVVGYASIAVS